MTTNKICELCKIPFEADEEQTHCDQCMGYLVDHYFFGTNPEILIKAADKYPELQVMTSSFAGGLTSEPLKGIKNCGNEQLGPASRSRFHAFQSSLAT